MSREIIDNALFENDAIRAKTILFSPQFPWYYANMVLNNAPIGADHMKKFKFHHIVCGYKETTTPAIEYVQPILNKLNVSAIFNCRIFLTTYMGENVNQNFHVDESAEMTNKPILNHMKTAIYYVNTNNGGTLFEDGQFVNSVENRLLIFNSQDRHAAITATDVAARIVVNINYF